MPPLLMYSVSRVNYRGLVLVLLAAVAAAAAVLHRPSDRPSIVAA